VQITVLNSDFVKESPQDLEMVLPTVFDLITPLLGNLPDIQVPTFAGFSLNNLSIQHVTTAQDDFLALYASLGAGMLHRNIAQSEPMMMSAVASMDNALGPIAPQTHGRARLVSVVTPPPEVVRSALRKVKDGAMPAVTFDADTRDELGRELEWSYSLDKGLWRPWQPGGHLVISDRAFAWQGRYTINLKSRVKGDYHTVSETISTPVIIDSVPPKVTTEQGLASGDTFEVPMTDMVSPDAALQYAWGKPGADKPDTAWTTGGVAKLSRADYDQIQSNYEVVLFAKDEAGNVSQVLIAPFHGQGNGMGCSCDVHGAPTAGGIVLIALVGIGLVRRRRPRRYLQSARVVTALGLWFVMSVGLSLVPGCSCSHPGESCSMASDCDPGACPDGQLPFCIDNTCVCSDDIPIGRLGPYSHVAVGPNGVAWVSAYAQSHGDLVVAQVAAPGRIPDETWEWVDGVPDGPVVVPNSKIRGGIADDGPDVGMYTSIAVAPDGTPMVTYFDLGTMDMPNANLKFAAKVNGMWQTHIVDSGTGQIEGSGGSVVGMYSSISLRTDDGRPGVAYLAHVADANGEHAEVRFAAAQVPVPTSAADWQKYVVDTAPVPAVDPQHPDVYPLPGGLGLFIDSARDPTNSAPVIVYYDRANGDLKLARFDTTAGQFKPAIVLDGSTTDVGWSPSVQVDAQGVAHVAYVSATADDLDYITDASGAMREIIDDGYRIVGQSPDGLPKPEFHFVGDDAGLVLPQGAQPMVVYQDSTTQQLMLAQRQQDATWKYNSIAGGTQPWPGAYGFFASAAVTPTEIVMSTWVIDQPTGQNWVEVFRQPTGLQ
jgi:MYXO-CTERM domain-containing protein